MPRRPGDDEDRPKRSWREIDRMRDKGYSRQRAQEERTQARVERSPLYEQYKAKVSRLFEGGELPDALREKLDPTGALKARDELLKRIRQVATVDRKQWADAVAEFVDKHALPDDAYLLLEWLDHPQERIVEKTLLHLEEMADAGTLAGPKVPKSADQRLRSLELTHSDPEVQGRAKALRERLRG